MFWEYSFLWKFPFLENGNIPPPLISQRIPMYKTCVAEKKSCIGKRLQTRVFLFYPPHPPFPHHLFKNMNFQGSTFSIFSYRYLTTFFVSNFIAIVLDNILNILLTVWCNLQRSTSNLKIKLWKEYKLNLFKSCIYFSLFIEYCKSFYTVSHIESLIISETSGVQRLYIVLTF